MLSVEDKLKIIADDIYTATVLNGAASLAEHRAGERVTTSMTEQEHETLLAFMVREGILSTARRSQIVALAPGDVSTTLWAYDITADIQKLQPYLGIMPPATGVSLHPTNSILLINGAEVKLGRGINERSLQYWICRLCLKKPSRPIKETDILAKYDTDFEITARRRAVSDATRKLNGKIQAVAGVDGPFIYSAGHVTFNDEKLMPSVKL